MATALAPRKPIDRGEVESWSKFRIREKWAAIVWFFYTQRVLDGLLLGITATLVIEHNDVTFPAIAAFFQGAVDLIVAGWNLIHGIKK